MKGSNGTAVAVALLITVQVVAQATDHEIVIDWNPLHSTAICGYFMGTRDVPFSDTAGSSWSHLKVRIPLGVVRTESGSGPANPAIVSIAINGVPVGDPVVVSNTAHTCGPYIAYEFAVDSLPGYRPLQQNTFRITSVGGSAGNAGEGALLTFGIEPRRFAFDLLPGMSEKIILHPHPNDSSLSPWQVNTTVDEKPRFRFRGAVMSNTTSPEADVWQRVVDPPDPSPYLPQHAPDDNEDPWKKGVLMPRGCADASCRAVSGQPLQVRSTPGGVVEVELEATDRYAGDNYILEASFDPAFTCATAGLNGANLCARSGQVTAWKRVFIEKRRMLRNGLFLAQDANVGDTFIVTRGSHWRGNRGKYDELSKGEQIVIVHAPQLDRSDLSEGWYSETHTILSVQDLGNGEFRVNLGTKKGKTIIPEPLQHEYRVDSENRAIGDAVSKLGSLFVTADDVFDVSVDLVTGEAFFHSFTENLILPDNTTPGAFVPVPFLETTDQTTLQHLAEKWSSLVNGSLEPNHQLLIIASDNSAGGTGTDAGLTISQVPGKRTSSWVFWETIDQVLSGNNVNTVNKWARKTAAHEIAHQWRTNGLWNPSPHADHCPATTKTWNDPSAYCLLADADPNGSGSVAQRTNGIARFHFLTLPNGSTHSEYLEIRRRPDPFVPNP